MFADFGGDLGSAFGLGGDLDEDDPPVILGSSSSATYIPSASLLHFLGLPGFPFASCADSGLSSFLGLSSFFGRDRRQRVVPSS